MPTTTIYADDTNQKHNSIVNQLQAWFPLKEKRQVVKLYVELVVEMTMREGQIGNQSGNSLVNNNYGIPREDPTMDNMDMSPGSLKGKQSEAPRMVEEAPQQQVTIPHQERRHKRSFWTTEEHKLIILRYKFILACTHYSNFF